MRQHVVDALAYPRTVILGTIQAKGCPHEARFDSASGLCRECGINGECHWIRWLDESCDLSQQPMHTLVASLRYGVALVRSLPFAEEHEDTDCGCQGCRWTRAANALIREFDAGLPANRFRPDS